MTPEDENATLSLRELYYIARRRWLLIVVTMVVLTSGAVALGMLQPDLYRATALVLVQGQQARVIEAQSVVDSLPTDQPMLETHANILRSRDHAMRVIEALDLAGDREFQKPAAPASGLVQAIRHGIDLALAEMPEGLLVATGLAAQTTGADAAAQAEGATATAAAAAANAAGDAAGPGAGSPAEQYAFDQFERRLAVSQDGKSYVIAVSFSARDPNQAATVANKVVELYLDLMERKKKETTLAASRWLLDRLEQLRREYLAAQDHVQQFRRDHNIVTTTGVELNERQLADLNSELVKVRAEKSERLAKLQLVRSLRQRGGLDSMAEVVDSELISRLREEQIMLSRKEAELRQAYGARHPKILEVEAERSQLERRIGGEVNRIIASLQGDMDVMTSRETNLQQEIDKAKDASGRVSLLNVQLGDLERQAEASRRLYDALLQRFEETKQQADLVKPDATLISRAAPPTTPDRLPLKLFALIGLVASGVTGGFLAVIVDRLSTRLRSGSELARAIGAPCLSIVPKLSARRRDGRRRALLGERSRSAFAESIRSIAAALQLVPAGAQGRTLAVTSAFSGEGKTSIATSLAAELARQSKRVLLIDLDLYRGSVEQLFLGAELVPVEPQRGDMPEILHHDATGVDLLLLHGRIESPASFVASPALKDLLARMVETHDWVIVDCPPTMGINDARLITRASDHTLLVAKWNDTQCPAIQVVAADLRSYGASILGGVLNFADMRKLEAHGYGIRDREGYYRKNSRYYAEQA